MHVPYGRLLRRLCKYRKTGNSPGPEVRLVGFERRDAGIVDRVKGSEARKIPALYH